MNQYLVFDQRPPIRDKTTVPNVFNYKANLPYKGTVRALDENAAIKEAKKRRMSEWPLVCEDTPYNRQQNGIN